MGYAARLCGACFERPTQGTTLGEVLQRNKVNGVPRTPRERACARLILLRERIRYLIIGA